MNILYKMLDIYHSNSILHKQKEKKFTDDEYSYFFVMGMISVVSIADYLTVKYNDLFVSWLLVIWAILLIVASLFSVVCFFMLLSDLDKVFRAIGKIWFHSVTAKFANWRLKSFEKNKAKINTEIKVNYQQLYKMFEKRNRLDVLKLLIDGMDSRNRFNSGNFYTLSREQIEKIINELDVNIEESDLSFEKLEQELKHSEVAEGKENIKFFEKKAE